MNFGLNPILSGVGKINDYSIWSKTFLVPADRFTAEALFNVPEGNTCNNLVKLSIPYLFYKNPTSSWWASLGRTSKSEMGSFVLLHVRVSKETKAGPKQTFDSTETN